MGYRHYFYKVGKVHVERIKDLGVSEIPSGEIFRPFGIAEEEVFGFGKLYWDDTAERIYSKGVPLYTKKETQDKFADYNPYVVGKDGLLEAIKIYKEKVLDYYASLFTKDVKAMGPFKIDLQPEDIKDIGAVLLHFTDKIAMLELDNLADTNESEKWSVTGSWEYEHSIFNLIHILKTMDWEKDTLLFYGW